MGIIISYHGTESSGKTSFGLSGPKPMVVFDFDMGYDRAIWRIPDTSLIQRIALPEPPEWSLGSGQATQLWAKYKTAWSSAMANSSVKALFIDSGTQWWKANTQEYLENYVMRTNKNRRQLIQIEYREPNDRVRSLIQEARLSNKVLFISHHETDKYEERFVQSSSGALVKDSAKTGERIHQGFGDIVYLADIHLRFYLKMGTGAGMVVPHCRILKPGLAPLSMLNMEIENPSFDTLMLWIEYYKNQELGKK